MPSDQPPPWLAALAAIREQVERNLERNQKLISETIRRSVDVRRFNDIARTIEANRKALIEPVLRIASEAAQRFDAALPPNWRDAEADFEDIVALTETGEIAVIWVPRAQVVDALAAENSVAGREAVLNAHRADVLADIAAALDEVDASSNAAVQEAHAQAREALAAAQAGLDRPAQSGFASALGHLLEGALGFPRPGAAYKQYKNTDLDDTLITELRIALLQVSTVNALTDTSANPAGFNRHGTQHGDPAYLTAAAMLGAGLLVAGWLRELHWLEQHRPDIFKTLTSAGAAPASRPTP